MKIDVTPKGLFTFFSDLWTFILKYLIFTNFKILARCDLQFIYLRNNHRSALFIWQTLFYHLYFTILFLEILWKEILMHGLLALALLFWSSIFNFDFYIRYRGYKFRVCIPWEKKKREWKGWQVCRQGHRWTWQWPKLQTQCCGRGQHNENCPSRLTSQQIRHR